MAESSGWRGLLDGLLGVAGEYVSQGVRISVKTNFGPEISLGRASFGDGATSDPGGGGFSLGALIGVKAAVIVRDADGREIATYGEPPPTDPVRVVVGLVILAGVVYLLVRGATR